MILARIIALIIGYMAGLLFVIPLGDLLSRKKLILANYIISACALLSIAVSPNIKSNNVIEKRRVL